MSIYLVTFRLIFNSDSSYAALLKSNPLILVNLLIIWEILGKILLANLISKTINNQALILVIE